MDDNSINYFVQTILSRSKRQCVNNTQKSQYYRGTFTSDDLLGNEKLKFNFSGDRSQNFLFGFIVNTITIDEASMQNKVGHWLAIAIRFNRSHNNLTVHFFDSFGKHYSDYKHVKSYISEVKSKCTLHHVKFTCDRLNKPIQDTFSKLCGLYACSAVTFLWESPIARNNLLKHSFSSRFGGDRNANDFKMVRYLYNQWPNRGCHNNGTPWKIDPIENLLKSTRPPAFCPKKTLALPRCGMPVCKC